MGGWVKKTEAADKEVKGKEKVEKRKVAETVKTRKEAMKKYAAKKIASRKQRRAARHLARKKHKELIKKGLVRDVKKVTGWVKKTEAVDKEVKGKEKVEKRKVAETVKTRKAIKKHLASKEKW